MDPKVINININDILPNRFQPRIAFNEDKLSELSESIKKYGVIQPITVRQIGNKYEIIAGERRYKASLIAGLEKIPAIVQNFSDEISSEVALIENVQREDLTAIEEAISYKKILDMGMITQEKLADKLGVSQPSIANKLRLLQLSEKVQDALMENKISERHARSLLKLKNKIKQEQMLHRIMNERLTVRKTDEEIKKIIENNGEEKVKNFIPSPEEIEILDIINSFKVDNKKEEEEVNSNDPINQFNIPTTDIENDVNEINKIIQPTVIDNNAIKNENGFNLESNTIQDINNINGTFNDSTVNPGFMDIDKIQKEAIDIMPKEEIKNVNLLKDMNIDSEIQKDSNSQLPHGKFFDVMPSMQNRMENTHVSTDEVKKSNINTNNTIFNNDSIFSDINFGVSQNIDNNNIENENNANDSKVENIQVEQYNNTDSISAFNNNVLSSNLERVEEPKIEQVQVEQYNNTDSISAFNNNVLSSNLERVEEPKIEQVQVEQYNNIASIPTVNIDEQKFIADSLKNGENNINNSISEYDKEIVINEPHIETIDMEPLPKENDVNIVMSKPLSFNMREGIQIVRSTIERLEKLGHQIESEEMDLPNKYEIKITLYK